MRRALALGLVLALVALGGCTSIFGPGQPSDQALNKNATYDWDTDATAAFVVERSEFRAVVTVENQSYLKVYSKDQLNNDEPLSVEALRFRYPNGTVVAPNESSLAVDVGGSRTNLTLPQAGGQVAFTAGRSTGKSFGTPLFVDGDQNVTMTLPGGARAGLPLLSKVDPGADSRSIENGQLTIRWTDVSGSVYVRYYLQRDILIFGGLFGLLLVAGVGGAVYYFRKIKVLERRREEIAPDVDDDVDDPDDSDPPPGMG